MEDKSVLDAKVCMGIGVAQFGSFFNSCGYGLSDREKKKQMTLQPACSPEQPPSYVSNLNAMPANDIKESN